MTYLTDDSEPEPAELTPFQAFMLGTICMAVALGGGMSGCIWYCLE